MSWPRRAASSCSRSSTSPSTTRAVSGASESLLASRRNSVRSTSSSANMSTARRAICPPAPSTSTFVTPCSPRCLLHVLVEEGDDLLGVPAEVVVAVLEPVGGVLDPEELLVLGPQQVERLLRVLGVAGPGVVEDLVHPHRHLDGLREMVRGHLGRGPSTHLQQLQVDQLLVPADSLQFRHGREDRGHGDHHRAAHASYVLEHPRSPVDSFVLRVAARALAVQADSHLAQLGVVVDVVLDADTVTPLPTTDAGDAT